MKILDGARGRVTKLSYSINPGHLSVWVEPDLSAADPAEPPEPQQYGAWKTAAGLYGGLTPVAIKVDPTGALVLGPDPGGAVQRCQTCVVIGGLNGLTPTALNVGADGTVAVSGGLTAQSMLFGPATFTLSNTPPTTGQCLAASGSTIIGTACSGGSAGGSTTQFLYNSGGVETGTAGITTDGNSQTVKGPAPRADLSALTRSVGFNGCATTATINIGTPTTATLASGSCFQTNAAGFNDGITIYGAGASVSISSPSAPTVTPNTISSGGVNLGGGNYTPNTVVNGATGSSTYSYILVAFDQFGGFAAPSSATTITNGPASLGAFSCAISTETRSGRNVTKNYSSACAGAVAGAMSLDTGTQPNPAGTFAGFFNTQTVNSSTQVVYSGPYDSNSFGWNSTDYGNSGTNSSSGGTSYFFNSNHLSWTYGTGVWRYGVCAERPGDGSYHRIGMTRPSTSQYKDIQFDDYGATMMASQIYPPYFTDAVCNGVAGQNDPLTTTITAGAGTTTVTLANAASNGVTSATALFDNGPGLVAAANSISGAGGSFGEVYIPPVTNSSNNYFVINSFTTIPSRVKIVQAGAVNLNETISLTGSDIWSGDASAHCGVPGLGYFGQPTACVYVNNANPGMYIAGSNVTMNNFDFTVASTANHGTMVVDDANLGKFSYVGFDTGSATDASFLTVPLVLRGGNGSNVCQIEMDHINFDLGTFSTTPGSWNPAILSPYAQASNGTLTNGGCTINLSKMSVSGHGIIQEGGGVVWNIDNTYRQGGIMPFLWHLNGQAASPETISFNTTALDTDGGSILSIGNNSGVPVPDIVKGYNIFANGGTTFGGFGPSAYDISYSSTTTLPNANGGFGRGCAGSNTLTNSTLTCNFDLNAYIGTKAQIFFPLPAPTGLSAPAAAGGSLASDTVTVSVEAVGPDGNQTIPSVSVSTTTSGTCPGSGNCELTLSWTPPATGAAASYTVFACYAVTAPTCANGINRQATGITGTTYTLTTLLTPGITTVPFTQTGQSAITASYVRAPQGQFPEVTAPTCFNNYDQLFGVASGHRLSFCDNAGSVDQVVGASTTDTLANKTVNAGTYTGAGTGSGSILLTGQRDGLVPVNATATTPCTFGTSGAGCFDKSYVTGYAFNQHATAAQAITYNLPVAATGKQYCVANSNNGSAANTGVITVATSGSGQFIIHIDGTLTASGGNVTSGGAAGDAACFVGIDSTHWQEFDQSGTWTKH